MARRTTFKKTVATTARGGAAKGGSDQVQSLARALSLLNRIAESPADGATLTDLAQQVGLPASTAHRLLLTLEQERYTRFDHGRRVWMVGVQAFVAGCAFIETRSLAPLARPHMRRLMEESGETVNLAVEDRGEIVYLAQVECRQIMRVSSRPGARVLMHCSAVGKAILSRILDKTIAKILHRHGMPRLTAKTITTPAALRAELEKARAQGFAVDDEEHAVGLRCIAAPIFGETGEVIAAVSVSGPVARIGEDRLSQLGRMLAETARAISLDMGAPAPRTANPT